MDVSVEARGDLSQATIEWVVEAASNLRTLATVWQQPGESTAKACWEEDFDCASIQAYAYHEPSYDEYGVLRILWNGVVWADEPSDLDQQIGQPLVWIGDGCHKHRYQVCDDYRDDEWLLDVELSTSKDATEDSIYWRVYADFGNGWGNLVHNPYHIHYRPNTTYRSLHCLKRDFGGCAEFGLYSESEPYVTNLTLRVDGEIKTEKWKCNHNLCDRYIVTPLRGCWGPALSKGAIAGIVIAAIMIAPLILLCFAVPWYSARSQPRFNQDQRNERGQPA